MGNNPSERRQGGRMGPGGSPRGAPRGYRQHAQPHDMYGPSDDQGGSMNQATPSSRLVSNTLNMGQSSNMPSNSGKC